MTDTSAAAVEIERLQYKRTVLKTYVIDVCLASEDWHGVMDAAADLREVDAVLAVLRAVVAGGAK